MTKNQTIRFGGLSVVLSLSIAASSAVAQTVQTFTGTASEFWTNDANWSPAGVPNASNIWAQIDSQGTTASPQRIFYPSSTLTSNTMSVGAISFLSTLSLSSGTSLSVQNNSSSTKGTLKLFGIDTTIGGEPRRILLDNSSTLSNVSFTQTLAGQDFELNSSGVIHVATGTSLTSTATILEAGGARGLTKIGPGTLIFSGTTSDDSVYSGGFTLEDGIVQWSNSGTSGVGTPFGLGPLTLQGGTLRSTTTTGRSINVPVVLDGGVTLGSTETGFTGNVTINSGGGSLTTTLLSDSVVAVADGATTIWNQAVSGSGNLTKAGNGLLNLNGFGGVLTYGGTTTVAAGTLVIDGAYTGGGSFAVQSGATLTGTGSIGGAATILAGGTLAPGDSPGVLTFGDDLSLGGATVMELNGPIRGTDYDGIDVAGSLGYGGTLELQIPATLADGTYDLFNGFSAESGTFTGITLTGAYAGSLTEASGVWTGSFAGQDFTFTNATGDLSIVPEPSVLLLAGLAVAAVAAQRGWRAARR